MSAMLPELGGSPRGEAEWYSGTRSPALATPAGRPILLLGGGGWWSLATASLVGGLATAAVVYLLAYRRGIQWFRLIVLNQAARYADHLMVMRDGELVVSGPPAETITAELVERVFGLRTLVLPDPVTGTPSVVPLHPRA